MSGIYIHIPFCRQACHYCNFHFSVSGRNRNAFREALLREIEMQKGYFHEHDPYPNKTLTSIYFGGGTPSVLSTKSLDAILNKISQHFSLSSDAEITIEANPDDLNLKKLQELKAMGINRLSIGIQSFHTSDLVYMNRIHSPEQAYESIINSKKAGFSNITIDLIYGTPGLSDMLWKENLKRALEFEIPHISAYALTVEQKTPLEYMIRKGKAMPVDEEQCARQFELMLQLLQQHGYLHYEISNFAQPGCFSRHNMLYWSEAAYLGLGPSAHSHLPCIRSWNISNTAEYIKSINQGIIPKETESLSAAQQFDEYVMTSLRTMWGCNLELIRKKWGEEQTEKLERQVKKHIRNGMLIKKENHLILTDSGKLFADGIASDLFRID